MLALTNVNQDPRYQRLAQGESPDSEWKILKFRLGRGTRSTWGIGSEGITYSTGGWLVTGDVTITSGCLMSLAWDMTNKDKYG